MRLNKLSKAFCIIAGCIVIGTSPVYADSKISYSEILSPGSSYDMSDLNNNATNYSWAVSGNTSSETMIGTDGTLVIGSDEEAKTVTVAATSLQDANTTNQYYIKIDPSVSKVSSEHASDVKEAAHTAKQVEKEKEKKPEIDFSKQNQIISAYQALDTSACQETDIKRMDSYVNMAKKLKSLDSISQDQIDANTSRLNYAYNILEQEAYQALPFYEKYKSQLMLGGAAAIGIVILLVVLLSILKKAKMNHDPEYAEKIQAKAAQKNRQSQPKKDRPKKKRKPSQAPAASSMNGRSVSRGPAPSAPAFDSPAQSQAPQQWSDVINGYNAMNASAGEEATTLLSDEEEETSLLSSKLTGVLTSQNTKEEFYITKPETIIGKERKRVDICISNDPTISRRHCCITIQNDQFYLSDLGSSNGTYFGGKKLIPQQPIMLHDGDRFTISDQTFLFRINEG